MSHETQINPFNQPNTMLGWRSFEELKEDFQARVSSITSRQLTPETIDAFAYEALHDLIGLVHAVEQAHSQVEIEAHETGVARETAAFQYFGLNSIEATLDHITQKAHEIDYIDEIIERAAKVDAVIVPTNGIAPKISTGKGEFQPKQNIPRTKTILFVLANAFDVDLHDPAQFRMITGEVAPDMLRQAPYSVIETPGINRIMLVCDEEDNATYVFDASFLEKIGLATTDLVKLKKPELNSYLEIHVGLGQRIVYNGNFVERLVEAVEEIRDNGHTNSIRNLRFLDPENKLPKAPKDFLSVKGIAEALDIASPTVKKAILELQEAGQLDEPQYYKFGANNVAGYSPDEQQLIMARLDTIGSLSPTAPDNYHSATSLSHSLGIDRSTVEAAIRKINPEQLGVVGMYKFGGHPTSGYSPQQTEIIEAELERSGIFTEGPAEGYLSVGGLAKYLRIAPQTVQAAIDRIEPDNLGETKQYRFSKKRPTTGYSPEQQSVVRNQLETDGALTAVAEDGYLSLLGMMAHFGVGKSRLEAAIDSIGADKLGEIEIRKFRTKNVPGFSPEQQALIHNHLDERGLLAPDAPAEYTTAFKLGRELGEEHRSIKSLVARIDPAVLGEVKKFKFSSAVADGYSPEQQAIIRAAFFENKQ